MKNTFKKLTAAIAVLFAGAQLFAVDLITSTNLVAATPFTMLDGGKFLIKSLYFVNGSSSNNATLHLYDSDGNATNIVRAASTNYTEVAGYRTNIWTNEFTFLVTNIEAIITRTASVVSAATNEAPYMFGKAVILGGGNRTFTTILRPLFGVTAYATQAGTLEITYEVVP